MKNKTCQGCDYLDFICYDHCNAWWCRHGLYTDNFGPELIKSEKKKECPKSPKKPSWCPIVYDPAYDPTQTVNVDGKAKLKAPPPPPPRYPKKKKGRYKKAWRLLRDKIKERKRHVFLSGMGYFRKKAIIKRFDFILDDIREIDKILEKGQ